MVSFSKPQSGRADRRRMQRMGLAAVATSALAPLCLDGSFVVGPGVARAPHAQGPAPSVPAFEMNGSEEGQGTRSTPLPAPAAALAAAAAGLRWIFPKRQAARKAEKAVVAGSIGFSSGSGGISSGGSSFLGSSMAGAVTGGSVRSSSATSSMTMLFERFNEKALRSVLAAQDQSRRMGQASVGVDTLLVGVLKQGGGVTEKVVKRLGLDVAAMIKTLQERTERSTETLPPEIPFAPECKKVLDAAVKESKDMGSEAIDPCHILVALLKSEEEAVKSLLPMEPEKLIEEIKAEIQRMEEEAEKTGETTGLVKKSATKALDEFGKNLTQAAADGMMDPLVGRDEEIDRAIQILARRSKNNPVLIGEAGVGKTSIALGLAQLIAEGKVPLNLQDKKVVQLDLALLLAGTRYRGDFEERLRAVVKEVSESRRRVILVVDEVHTLVGAGSGGDSGGGMDAANLLKPALARGELQCIGATTLDEYRKYIEKDPALERRFQPVTVPEPSEDESVQILKGLAPKYERHHQLQYAPEALEACVKLANQFIADRCLPDKAIDVMDEAGSKVRQQLFEAAEESHNAAERWAAGRELKEVIEQKKVAVNSERYDEAAQLKRREDELEDRLARLQSSPENQDPQGLLKELQSLGQQIREAVTAERFAEAQELKMREREVAALLEKTGVTSEARRKVTPEDVAQVVSGWTGIAVEQVSASESARLLHLEKELHESIIGQDEAVGSVSRALRRARAGLRNPRRPMAGFMFCGPTGVGKTALCKTLSKTFFGTEDTMIRLDMSEFMEKHTVSKLIGAPPGYVGYNDGGSLTEAVRRRPYSLVLFDEVEKAHPDVFNVLLQLLDDGRLTDSKGRVVSFANTMVIMTSNIGSRSVSKSAAGTSGLGFHSEEDAFDTYAKVKEAVDEEMKSFFRPEFLNRLDEVIVFRPLKEDDIRQIAEVEFKKVLERLSDKYLHITLTQSFKDQVLKEGFDPAYGARPLRRAITRMLEDTLAEQLLEQTAEEEEIQHRTRHVTLSVSDGKVKAEFKEMDAPTGDSAVDAKSPVLEGATRS